MLFEEDFLLLFSDVGAAVGAGEGFGEGAGDVVGEAVDGIGVVGSGLMDGAGVLDGNDASLLRTRVIGHGTAEGMRRFARRSAPDGEANCRKLRRRRCMTPSSHPASMLQSVQHWRHKA